MLRFLAVAASFAVLLTSSAFAQVIYEPVRYQFETPQGQTYYYGGVDPRVHALAAYDAMYQGRRGYATNLHNFDGGNSFGQPAPLYDRRPAVYTDAAPFTDASVFGFTPDDARNEAYANAPTYFRKADLLASAVPTHAGGWVVPAQAPDRYAAPQRNRSGVGNGDARPPSATNPSTRPGQVIIIPKRLLHRKLHELDRKPLVASAK